MKKKYLLIIFSMIIVGVVGSLFVGSLSVPKFNSYFDEKRAELMDESDLINTDSKVEILKIGNLPRNTVINVKKSNSNKVNVHVKSTYGKDVFSSRMDKNTLVIDAKDMNRVYEEKIFGKPVFNRANEENFNQINSFEEINDMLDFIKSLRHSKDVVRNSLNKMAIDGARFDKNTLNFDATYIGHYSVVDVEVPNSVDMQVYDSKYYNIHMNDIDEKSRLNIDDGLVKNYIKVKKVDYIDEIAYKDKIDKIMVDIENHEEYLSLDNRNKHFDLNINILEINTNPSVLVDLMNIKGKIANELILNVSGEKKLEKDFYQVYDFENNEDQIQMDVLNMIEDYFNREDNNLSTSERDLFSEKNLREKKNFDKLEKVTEKDIRINELFRLFADDIVSLYDYEHSFGEKIHKEFGVDIYIGKDIADKVKINAPKDNVRLVVYNYNPELDIKSEKIEDKYLLYGKVPNSVILENNKKEYKGNLDEYIHSVYKNAKIDMRTSGKPVISVNSKKIRLLEMKQEEYELN